MTTSSGTRPLNVSYLVVGLIFLGISGSWALHASGAVDTSDVQWLMPLVLVGAGAIGLIAFTAKGLTRGRGQGQREETTEEAAFDPYPDQTEVSTEQAEQNEQTEQTDVLDQSQQTEQTTRIEGDDR